MKQSIKSDVSLKPSTSRSTVMPSVSLSIALSLLGLPSFALAESGYKQVEEVMVTARRKEENIQDVPIAISIYSQEQLDQANIVSGSDLALYNPSLASNNRFGSDAASFAIRGFTQELRTTSSVGVYFAEVVAPRGSGLIVGGDGAGPGYFFDLQNVQVLKGPQGTLFGRNTTGGAVVLSPQKPTDVVEGFLEVGSGNYDMVRGQGALNIPISDRVRARVGFDSQKRDGYLHNISGVGPEYLADVDYTAARASLVIDITDSLENYSIFNYLNSENNGVVAPLFGCNTDLDTAQQIRLFGQACVEQLAAQGDDFYTTMTINPEPTSKSENWQFINTTTWDLTDDVTVKNIISWAEVKQNVNSTVFGTAWLLQDFRIPFTGSFPLSGVRSNHQTSFVEELQFQGTAFDGDMTWQTGLYYENNEPGGLNGTASPFFSYCDPNPGHVPADFQCIDSARILLAQTDGQGVDGDPGQIGFVQRNIAEVEYTSKAIFGEFTYTISDALNVSAGLRYTEDKTESTSQQIVYRDLPPFPGNTDGVTPVTPGAPTNMECTLSTAEQDEGCVDQLDNESEAVTGQMSVNFYPVEDVMTYAKYSKGYRQAGVNVLGPEGVRPFDEEEVDAYELGAKASFEGYISGTLNMSAFYNDLTNQQLQTNVINSTNEAVSTTAIINVGSSVIAGFELESMLQFPWYMSLNLAYTHLDTEVKEYADFSLPDNSAYDTVEQVVFEGSDLTFSPKHNLTATLSQVLPVPIEIGDMVVSATYVYTDEQLSTANSPLGITPDYELWNFNFNWSQMFGSGLDLSLFITNAFDEEVTNYVNGLYNAIGNEYRIVGEPKMYGAKLRYTFE